MTIFVSMTWKSDANSKLRFEAKFNILQSIYELVGLLKGFILDFNVTLYFNFFSCAGKVPECRQDSSECQAGWCRLWKVNLKNSKLQYKIFQQMVSKKYIKLFADIICCASFVYFIPKGLQWRKCDPWRACRRGKSTSVPACRAASSAGSLYANFETYTYTYPFCKSCIFNTTCLSWSGPSRRSCSCPWASSFSTPSTSSSSQEACRKVRKNPPKY